MKTAVISGGSRGIGKAIALNFLKNGFRVYICARTEEYLVRLQAELDPTIRPYLFVFKADVSKKIEVSAFAMFVKNSGHSVDVLVNNAGKFTQGSLLQEDENTLEFLLQTNVLSAYYLTRFIHPILKKEAHIFNVCSIASLAAYQGNGSYTVSKFAMLGFSKSLRLELQNTNVKVTAVLPGPTDTDSWAGVSLPAGRLMNPEDIAEAVYSAYNLGKNTVLEELILRPQMGDL